MASKRSQNKKKHKITSRHRKNQDQTRGYKEVQTTTCCKDCKEPIVIPLACVHGCKRVNCHETTCHRAHLDRHDGVCKVKLTEATKQVLEALEQVETTLGRPVVTICGILRDDLAAKLKDVGLETLLELKHLLDDHDTKHDIRIFEDFDFVGNEQGGDPLRSSLNSSLPETPSALGEEPEVSIVDDLGLVNVYTFIRY